jgi:hypothetical protein
MKMNNKIHFAVSQYTRGIILYHSIIMHNNSNDSSCNCVQRSISYSIIHFNSIAIHHRACIHYTAWYSSKKQTLFISANECYGIIVFVSNFVILSSQIFTNFAVFIGAIIITAFCAAQLIKRLLSLKMI